MSPPARTIDVSPGSEVDRLLDQADEAPLVLVGNGVRYRLQPEDIWAYYDPERVRQVLAETAGAWKNIDTEALKADFKAQRGQDSSGRPGD